MSEPSGLSRRRFLGAAATFAAGTTGLFPFSRRLEAMTDAAAGVAQQTGSGKTAIRPFHVSFSDEELSDLRRRVKATRWPSRELVNDASQGVQLATVQKLAQYWATDYDWRKCEARLNAVPNFMTEIDGVDIHFLHVRSKHENARSEEHTSELQSLRHLVCRLL